MAQTPPPIRRSKGVIIFSVVVLLSLAVVAVVVLLMGSGDEDTSNDDNDAAAAATAGNDQTVAGASSPGGAGTTAGASSPGGASTPSGPPACVGGLVTPNCNMSMSTSSSPANARASPTPEEASDSICGQRFIVDPDNPQGYVQCKLSTNGQECNAYNNSDKSDKQTCNVEGEFPPPCRMYHNSDGANLAWMGYPSRAGGSDALLRNESRNQCTCPDEPEEGWIGAGLSSPSPYTSWHGTKNLWRCKSNPSVGNNSI